MSHSPDTAENNSVLLIQSGAGRWIFISRVFVQLSQLTIFLVAARVLSPTEFGVFALAQTFTVLLFMIAAAGWRELVIGCMGSNEDVNQIITYAFIGGIGMFFFGLLSA